MEANDLLRQLIELLLKADEIIGNLLDAATQLEDEGTFTLLSAGPRRLRRRRRKTTPLRRTSATAHRKSRFSDTDDIRQIEFRRHGKRVRVLIAGLAPIWMSPQRAALLRALAEPTGQSADRCVGFKTADQLQRRIEQLTKTSLKPHSIASSISRLRKKSLRDRHDLIQTRDAHVSGEPTAYRFLMLAGGRLIEHPPDASADDTAIDPATGGDR